MGKTIKVTGRGNISVHPDTTRLLITLNETFSSYDETVKESAKKKKALTKELEGLGFAKSDLKTLNFRIEPDYQDYHDENGRWQQQLVGYRYVHEMKLEFPIDNDRLGKLFYVLAHCPGAPEFRVQATIADPDPVKNQLLAKAVHDAKEKAAILAEAGGVVLKDIMTIDYSWGEIELVSRLYNSEMSIDGGKASAKMGSYDLDLEADDIPATDTVTVVWEIA